MAVFGKKQKDLMDAHISTIISDGCKIDGNISSSSSVRIDGHVHGNVQVGQGVIIGTTGKIYGDVVAEESIVFGLVKGNVSVKKLEIKSTGVINGDLSTHSMEVEFGAVYNGKVSMKSADQATSTKANHEVKENVFVQEG